MDFKMRKVNPNRRWKDSLGLEPARESSFKTAPKEAEGIPVILPEHDISSGREEATCFTAGRKIIDGTAWGLFIVVLALIALFIDDLEILVFTWGLEHTDDHGSCCMLGTVAIVCHGRCKLRSI